MKKRIILALAAVVVSQASAVQAESRYDKIKERVRAKAKVTPNVWEQMRKEDAARAAKENREKVALETEVRKKYGVYVDRATEVAKTLYFNEGHSLYIYLTADMVAQIKDNSVLNNFLSIKFERSTNYSAANIANNGIVEIVKIDYIIDLNPYSSSFIRREYIRGWNDWRNHTYYSDHLVNIFSVVLINYADGKVISNVHSEFSRYHDDDLGKLNYYLTNGDANFLISPMDCDWAGSFEPYKCVSWHSGFQNNDQRRAALEVVKKANVVANSHLDQAGVNSDPVSDAKAIRDAFGLSVISLDERSSNALGVAIGVKGVVIDALGFGTAKQIGLQRGDVIVSANYKAFSTTAGFATAIREAQNAGRSAMLLGVKRSAGLQYVSVRFAD